MCSFQELVIIEERSIEEVPNDKVFHTRRPKID